MAVTIELVPWRRLEAERGPGCHPKPGELLDIGDYQHKEPTMSDEEKLGETDDRRTLVVLPRPFAGPDLDLDLDVDLTRTSTGTTTTTAAAAEERSGSRAVAKEIQLARMAEIEQVVAGPRVRELGRSEPDTRWTGGLVQSWPESPLVPTKDEPKVPKPKKLSAKLTDLGLGAQAAVSLKTLMKQYSKYDPFKDTYFEHEAGPTAHSIESLEPYEDPKTFKAPPKYANLVLVIVEKRLTDDKVAGLAEPPGPPTGGFYPGVSTAIPYGINGWPVSSEHPSRLPMAYTGKVSLDASLKQLAQDINSTPCDFNWQRRIKRVKGVAQLVDGRVVLEKVIPDDLQAVLIKAELYSGVRHQDGRTLLMLRRFLQDVRESYPNLRGVILVGAFPDALLVRRWHADKEPYVYTVEEEDGKVLTEGHFGTDIYTEILAYRSDIVLGDLDGDWEKIYYEGPVTYPIDEKGWSVYYKAATKKDDYKPKQRQTTLRDFFLINDVGDKGDKTCLIHKGGEPSCWEHEWYDFEVGKSDKTRDPKYKKQEQFDTLLYRLTPDLCRVIWRYDTKSKTVSSKDLKGEVWADPETGKLWSKPSLGEKVGDKVVAEEYSQKPPGLLKKGEVLINEYCQPLNVLGTAYLRNTIASPDIIVSRINARNIAWSAPDGLDPTSYPTRYPFQVPRYPLVRDPYLERVLLIRYFARNSAYRNGSLYTSSYGLKPLARKCTAIAMENCDEGHWLGEDLRAAFPEVTALYGQLETEKAIKFEQYPDCGPNAFVAWLSDPALVRSMSVHGSTTGFGIAYDTRKKGTPPKSHTASCVRHEVDLWDWRHLREGSIPGNYGMGKLTWTGLHGSFYWDISSYANAPFASESAPYNDWFYGFGQVSESLLFYRDGLAVIARGHSEYGHPGRPLGDPKDPPPDPPGGPFDQTLRMGRSFGEVWRAIFERERQDGNLADNSEPKRKNAYRWGIVGDWTLNLYKRGLNVP